MKRRTVFLAALAALLLLAVLPLSAGGGAEKKGAAADKPLTVRIFNRVNVDVNLENNPILAQLEKKTNTKIVYEAPPINNYVEKLQLLMATSDLPDLIYNWGGADFRYEQWVKDGILTGLDGIVTDAAKYPNINKELTAVYWDSVRSVTSGKIQIIPRPNPSVSIWGYIVNQQWLDKLGLKKPETKEQLVEVMKAFTTRDPDGNGKADTYGVSLAGREDLWNEIWLEAAFSLSKPPAPDVDGTYRIFEKKQNYLPYLRFLREIYTAGLVDPESFQNKGYDCWTKREQNRVGITYGGLINVVNAVNQRGVKDSAERFSFAPVLANAKGEHSYDIGPSIWGGWMIPESSKPRLAGILKFLDYGYSPEGVMLLMSGMEGTDYTSYDAAKKLIVRTADQLKTYKMHTSTYMTLGFTIGGYSPIIEGADTPELFAKFAADQAYCIGLKAAYREVPTLKATKLVNFPTQSPDVYKKLRQTEIEFVAGKVGEDVLVKYLNEVYFPAVKDAEDEYLKIYQK